MDFWTPGNKQGVGTAFTYDQPAGDANPSRVWFGITDGAITEGLYPDVSQANIKSLGVLVSDGKSFLADETTDATYTVERLDARTPAYRVTSTDKGGRWAVTKEIVADPQSNTILFTVAFKALQGQPEDYRLFLSYTPRIGQSGAGDLSRIAGGVAEAWDEQAGVYTALATDPSAGAADHRLHAQERPGGRPEGLQSRRDLHFDRPSPAGCRSAWSCRCAAPPPSRSASATATTMRAPPPPPASSAASPPSRRRICRAGPATSTSWITPTRTCRCTMRAWRC